MKYIPCIGLEMHCEISKTNTKVFSAAKNEFTEYANSNIRPVDLGFPGTLPVVNKEAVKKSLMASIILSCKQPEYMYFERKNYYYPDLPKGYQITQDTKPIPVGIDGEVKFTSNGEEKTIRINNIHLEEDSASLDHYENNSMIDYNRAGVPLLELVTEPDLHNANDAVAFLEHMRLIYRYANISDADSKKGQIRCDVNVSIMDSEKDPTDPMNWGTKVEIKNVNSFSAVKDVINYEIERQIKAKENNTYFEEVKQETRRWDEEAGVTKFMRSKVDAIDYKYFVEPNIPKYKITSKWLQEIKKEIPELPYERKKRYMDLNVKENDAQTIIKEKSISDYFDKCLALNIDAVMASNWLCVNIIGELNKENISIDEFFITPVYLKEIIDAILSGNISSKQAKEVFTKALLEKKEPKLLIEKLDSQISDKAVLKEIIETIISNNQNQVEAYKLGKTNLFDFFVGQVMKETRGKANPVITKELLNDKLNN